MKAWRQERDRPVFATLEEAIKQVVVPALGEHAYRYDVRALAHRVFARTDDGQWVQTLDGYAFWNIVNQLKAGE